MMTHEEIRKRNALEQRQLVRDGQYQGHTAGLMPTYLQANLVIVEEAFAPDFEKFCNLNAKACPVVGISEIGSSYIPVLDCDVKTDASAYNVYRDGQLQTSMHEITALWTSSLVAFALGCSFSFEEALLAAGIRMAHIEQNKTVPMFRTNRPLQSAGVFGGEEVVSMRPIRRDQVDEARVLSGQFPQAHGAPIHVGDPEVLGIEDLSRPDWGQAVDIQDSEVPVFWPCGVTPQVALQRARLPFSITHKPGHMLLTSVPAPDAKGVEFPFLPFNQTSIRN